MLVPIGYAVISSGSLGFNRIEDDFGTDKAMNY
jgi:hypothetical protein